MNEKRLTKKEIQRLFQFMKEHGVKSYDIQLELVDHFATKLEQEWENYPEGSTFEQKVLVIYEQLRPCLLYTSPSPRDGLLSRMPSSA